ncbi:uncharacterized protein LOC130657938 [Hydractinia symbiolongicarpus]|uniref:uncharacterized protein LOC130657938 n=1 Tax=Hydractinia symbiolongicarpus TaxID=13093 RepID=UPI00254CCCAB|nr:uncharacterized protein LOC130657938 [Hydractinia symbiolongicarpus]
MSSFQLSIGIILLFAHFISCGLESCYKCTDTPLTDAKQCIKDKDWCAATHDRCLLMKEKNSNGAMVYEARCSTERECFSDAAKKALCDKKNDCKVLMCCDSNSCNTAHATWIRFDVRLLLLVVISLTVILWK